MLEYIATIADSGVEDYPWHCTVDQRDGEMEVELGCFKTVAEAIEEIEDYKTSFGIVLMRISIDE